jgi:hypothetical protein
MKKILNYIGKEAIYNFTMSYSKIISTSMKIFIYFPYTINSKLNNMGNFACKINNDSTKCNLVMEGVLQVYVAESIKNYTNF